MLKTYFPTKAVPRVEYDHRAREARLRYERVESQFLKRSSPTRNPRWLRVLRLLVVSVSGRGGSGDQGTGSPSDRRPCNRRGIMPDATVFNVSRSDRAARPTRHSLSASRCRRDQPPPGHPDRQAGAGDAGRRAPATAEIAASVRHDAEQNPALPVLRRAA